MPDKVALKLPDDRYLELASVELAKALVYGPDGPYRFQDNTKAVWIKLYLQKITPALTPTALAKLLTDLSYRSNAREELFRLSRYEGLAEFLVNNGVDAKTLTEKWQFDAGDAIQLIAGIVRGVVFAIGITVRDLIVFGIAGAFFVGIFGPLVGGLLTIAFTLSLDTTEKPVDPSKRPNLDSESLKLPIKDPRDTINSIWKLLSNPKIIALALDDKRLQVSSLMVARKFYEAGQIVGDIAVQALLVGVTLKQLATLAPRIAPRLTRLGKDAVRQFSLVTLWAEVKMGKPFGKVGDLEFFRLRDSRLMVRSAERGAFELPLADLEALATEEPRIQIPKAAKSPWVPSIDRSAASYELKSVRGLEDVGSGVLGKAARGTELRLPPRAGALTKGAADLMSRPITGPSFAGILESKSPVILRSTADAAEAAVPLVNPEAGRLGFFRYNRAAAVRKRLGMTEPAEAAHLLPQAAGANLANYRPGRSLTTFLHPDTHGLLDAGRIKTSAGEILAAEALDAGWLREWNRAVASGEPITASAVQTMVSNAIEQVPPGFRLSRAAKGTLAWKLELEIYAELGLSPGTILR